MNKMFSRLLWLPSITDQPVTVGELLSIGVAVAGGLAAITAMCHIAGAAIRTWFQ